MRLMPLPIPPPSPASLVWHAHIKGPAGTPYEGGHFELLINFPEGACMPHRLRWQSVGCAARCSAGSAGTLIGHCEFDRAILTP
jgi:hypothetical protein